MMRAPSWFGRWIRRLGIAFGLLLAVGIVGEIALRMAPSAPPGPRALVTTRDPAARSLRTLIETQTDLNLMIYAPDPELGALLAPSRQDVVATVDFTYTLRTDHAGFPNPEPWPERVDVAVLGNSLLVGPGVGMDGQFTSLLEDRLQGRTVLNLGLPGGGTEHELLTYRRFVEPLQPKLVVAALWVIWDIDNSLQFARWLGEGKPDPDYTHYRYTYSDTHPTAVSTAKPAEGHESALEKSVGFVRHQVGRSRLVRAGYQRIQSLREGKGMTILARFPRGGDLLLSGRYQERLTQGMQRPGESLDDIREIFFPPLERLRTEVQEKGGRFLIALVPSKEELYGADASPAVLRTVDEVKAELEARQLPILDLYPTFRELGQTQPPFYSADMHLNELGNQIVADAIAKWIADEQIFAGAKPGRVEGGRK